MKGERRFRISVSPETNALLTEQISGEPFERIEVGYTHAAPAPLEVVVASPPSLEPEGPGHTYEIFLELHHHPRHLDDDPKQLHRCWKLVDTGKPREMIANALRELADRVEEGKHG